MASPEERARENAQLLCKEVNKAFGYMICLDIALESLGIKDRDERIKLIQAARNRNIDEFKVRLLCHMKHS